MGRLRVLGIALVVALLVAGCAKAPEQQIDAAKVVLDSAKQAEADRYVPNRYNAAKDSIDAAMAEVDKQNAKSALTRSYVRAKKLLESATTAANAAKEAAGAAKEQARIEAEGALEQVQQAITETEGLLKEAPVGKEGRAALAEIKAALEAVQATLTEAKDALTQGDYLAARDKANSCIQKANELSSELKAAIEKKAKAYTR